MKFSHRHLQISKVFFDRIFLTNLHVNLHGFISAVSRIKLFLQVGANRKIGVEWIVGVHKSWVRLRLTRADIGLEVGVVPQSLPILQRSTRHLFSIGPYLQKEFDADDNASKTVKVYMQVRQENSIEKNFADLKTSMGKLHASVGPALEAALKKGDTTVEFEAEVGPLKTTVATLNKAVSGIEISLPTVK